MVGDHALVAAGDEDEVLDPRLARLVDHILQRRPVDDGQHLLRHGLGGGEEAGAEAGHGKDRFAERIYHRPFEVYNLTFRFPQPWRSLTFPIRGPIETVDAGLSVMSVLVTGGAGFIGGHMVLELADRGERVDRARRSFHRVSTGRCAPKAELVIGDIGDRVLLDRLMKSAQRSRR